MLVLIHALDVPFNDVLDYYNSFTDKWNDLNCYAITKVEKGSNEYFEYINSSENNLYYLIDDEKPNYIIGYGSIEDSFILNYHKDYFNAGNIGYGIRVNERNKGYGTILLKLLLEKCEVLGIKEVCVSCHKKNIASKKVIIKNGGYFEKEFYDDWTNEIGLKFWIKTNPRLIDRGRRLINLSRKEWWNK